MNDFRVNGRVAFLTNIVDECDERNVALRQQELQRDNARLKNKRDKIEYQLKQTMAERTNDREFAAREQGKLNLEAGKRGADEEDLNTGMARVNIYRK